MVLHSQCWVELLNYAEKCVNAPASRSAEAGWNRSKNGVVESSSSFILALMLSEIRSLSGVRNRYKSRRSVMPGLVRCVCEDATR